MQYHPPFTSLVSDPVTARYGDEKVAFIEKDYSQSDRTRPYLHLFGQQAPKE